MEAKQCGCGKTKNADGSCDGSHAQKTASVKSTPFDKITVRVISTESNQKTKNVFVSIANNKALMKRMGFTISDPNYEAKMEAFKNRKPYIETAKKPVTA